MSRPRSRGDPFESHRKKVVDSQRVLRDAFIVANPAQALGKVIAATATAHSVLVDLIEAVGEEEGKHRDAMAAPLDVLSRAAEAAFGANVDLAQWVGWQRDYLRKLGRPFSDAEWSKIQPERHAREGTLMAKLRDLVKSIDEVRQRYRSTSAAARRAEVRLTLPADADGADGRRGRDTA
jgi:hypothetical protein